MKTRILFSVIALLIFTICAKAQVVNGKVVDAANGKPVANASIYLKGLSRGTISNAQGEFILKTTESKTPLIISYVGYRSDTLLNYSDKLLTIKLEPHANELTEVVINKGDGISRERKLKIFIREFIGSNSKDCIINNPDDVNLRYKTSTKILEGEATKPLLIYNKKLGYKITFYLSSFFHCLEGSSDAIQTFYKGNYSFEEDTLGLPSAEIKKILKARNEAYFGSRMHFMRSVCDKNLEENKFSYQNNNRFDNRLSNKYAGTLFIFNNIRANQSKLCCNTYLSGENFSSNRPVVAIAYKIGFEPHNRGNWSQVTFKSGDITFRKQPEEVSLTPTSYNESDLLWGGVMARQRVGELLPLDFISLEAP